MLLGLTYTDDIALLAEKVEDLQRLLSICKNEATTLGLKFNSRKSAVL